MHSLKAILTATILACSFAYAAEPVDCEGLKFATGPRDKATGKGKGYSRLFDDIQKVCGTRVALCEVSSKGGLDNLSLLSTNEADIAPAQVDTVNDLKTGDENVSALQEVVPLNYNFLHIVVAANGFTIPGEMKTTLGYTRKVSEDVQRTINRFSDLRGQTVAVVGSAELVMTKLNNASGYKMTLELVGSDEEAFAKVKKGTVAAMASVSGWPSGTISSLDSKSGLTMVPFDAAVLAGYVVKPIPQYKNIGVYNNNAMAVPNVLLSRPFTGEKATFVRNLRSCIADNLSKLKEGSYAPGWNEVKSLDSAYGLPKIGAGTAVKAVKAAKK